MGILAVGCGLTSNAMDDLVISSRKAVEHEVGE